MQHTFRNRDCTVIDRVRIRSRVTDSLAAQQRIANLLCNAVLRPARLPPWAILHVRKLYDPLPHTRWLDERRVHLPPEWEEAAAQELDCLAAQAVRPALAPVPPSAQAVLFLDRAELLMCLAADWLQGTMGANWWWITLLKRGGPDSTFFREWTQAPEFAPAALEMLVARSRAVELVQRLADDVAASLLEGMLQAFGVPSGSRRQENPNRAISKGEPDLTSPLTPELRTSETPPCEPWLPYVPEASAPELPPLKRVLLAQALMLRRAPARARSIAFQQDMAEWQLWAAEHPAPRRVREEKPDSPAESTVEPKQDGWQTAEPAGHQAAKGFALDIRDVGPGLAPANADPSVGRTTAAQKREQNSSFVRHNGLGDQLVASPAEFPTVDSKQDEWQTAEPAGHQQIPAPAAHTRALPPTPDNSASSATAFETVASAFGGVFFLVNVALYLKLYGDFTSPREKGVELDIWDFLCLLGLEFVGDEVRDDAIFEIFATLAGRTKSERPGTYFEPPRDWHVPPEWLEPFPESFERKEVVRGGRLQVVHPAGFLLVDESSDLDPESVDPLPRWLGWVAGYIRARLARALGRDDAAEFLCRVPARIAFTSTHVDVFYSLDQHPIEIRLAGLDRDPGWVPAAGRYVAYHFD
jgi:hypothetical protein